MPVPTIPDGQFAVFNGQGWFLTSEPEPPMPPEPEPIVGPDATGLTPTVI